MAHAVSRRPLTAEDRLRPQSNPYGIFGGQSGIETGFLIIIEGRRSRCYGRTAGLRHIVQPCDEDDEVFSAFPF